jgi:hypothetical protein
VPVSQDVTIPALQRAFATPAAAGDTQLVAAQGAGLFIKVHAVLLMASATVNVKLKSGGATDISPLFPIGANGGFAAPYNEKGWFITAANDALNVNLSGAVSTAVHVLYTVTPQG